jgi:hypothetical protein
VSHNGWNLHSGEVILAKTSPTDEWRLFGALSFFVPDKVDGEWKLLIQHRILHFALRRKADNVNNLSLLGPAYQFAACAKPMTRGVFTIAYLSGNPDNEIILLPGGLPPISDEMPVSPVIGSPEIVGPTSTGGPSSSSFWFDFIPFPDALQLTTMAWCWFEAFTASNYTLKGLETTRLGGFKDVIL